MEVSIRTFCEGTTAANAQAVRIGPLEVYFSYRTLVAFQVDGAPPIVRLNTWGPTTGKHLNAIDGGDKEARLEQIEFDKLLQPVLLRLTVSG